MKEITLLSQFKGKMEDNLYSNKSFRHFLDVYDCFSPNKVTDSVEQWLIKEFNNFIVDKLRQNISTKTCVQVLGVGSGNGYNEILQLKKLRDQFDHVDVSVVEPSEKLIGEYKDAVKIDADASKGISYQWLNQSLHDVCSGTEKKYHFISSIHSVYFLGKPEDAITNLYNVLEPGGAIFIFLNGGILSIVDELALPPRMNSQRIKSALDKLDLPYRQHPSDLPQWFDVSSIVDEDHSKEYELLMDFLTSTVNFTKTASYDTQRKVIEYIKHAAVSRNNEGTFLHDPCSAFIITK